MAFVGSFAYLVLDAPGIVKPGYSDDYRERMAAHRSDGKLAIACLRVSNGLAAERLIMAALVDAGFKPRPDLGREYFEGDPYDALRLFWQSAFPLASVEPLTHAARRAAAPGLADADADADADVAMDTDDSDGGGGGHGAAAVAPQMPPIPTDPMWQVMHFLGPLVADLAGQVCDANELYVRLLAAVSGRPPKFTRFVDVATKLYKASMYVERGRPVLRFPAGCPKLAFALDWIDAHVDFSPKRRAEDCGRQHFAYIRDSELRDAVWKGWAQADGDGAKADFKDLVKNAMAKRQRRCRVMRPNATGAGVVGYDMARLKLGA